MSLGTTATSPAVSTAHLDASTSREESSPAASDGSGDAQVHEADTYSRGALRWGYFLLLNAIAGAIAVAFFIAVFYADGLDPYLVGTYQWLLAHPGVTSSLAFSPLACSLLVGYGYASRARKRKKYAALRALKAKSSTPELKTAQAE